MSSCIQDIGLQQLNEDIGLNGVIFRKQKKKPILSERMEGQQGGA
jgi:hypothetical protein